MDLNSIIFPSPKFDYCLEGYEKELIFIPKKDEKQNKFGHIPCLLLQGKLNIQSKYYLLFFHGNAEDIFIAKDIASKIKNKLYVFIIFI